MLKNYLKIALRNVRADRAHTLINTFGLAVGIASCTLIMLFVRSEWSFDRFHTNSDRLFRAWVLEDYGEGRRFHNTVTPLPLGPELKATFPEVEQVVRVNTRTDLVRRGETSATERMHMVDATFFEVFDFPLLEGRPGSVLTDPNSVVLTPTVAARYFGDESPLGKTLAIDFSGQPQDFLVTGIAAEPPTASSIQFDLLISFEKARDVYSENQFSSWFNVYGETYVLVGEGVSGTELQAKLPLLVTRVIPEDDRSNYTVGLQPITDIHLNQELPSGIEPTSDPRYAYILSIVALLILLIACINFITLAIGQSARRAREVGVRKALGAGRGTLMRQFWSEALLLVALGLAAGVMLAQVLLPFFNDLAGRELRLAADAGTFFFLLGLLLVIGFGAGSYPALVLSGFRPIDVLKDRLQLKGDRSLLRRGLIVVQFTLSILMIISTLLIVQQLRFLQNSNLGFDKEQVIVIRTGVDLAEAQPIIERFRNALDGHSDVAAITASAYALNEGWLNAGYTATDGSWRTFRMNWGLPNLLETMGMELAAGRAFSADLATDSSKIIVNEALVRDYGWASAEAALGRSLPGSDFPPHEIVGVVRDFHFESLRSEISPLVIAFNPNVMLRGASDVSASTSSRRKIAVRVRPGDLLGAVSLVRSTWTEVAPDLPFDYYFLDEAVDSQYRQEERLARIIGAAALLSIIVACLGLFGLATLTVVRRTKEIGIRKVLGATSRSIVMMLSRDFARLVLVGFIVAAPLAYLAADRWLQDFAYRIDLAAQMPLFLTAGLMAMVVALATVGYHAFRAAGSDPVKSLKYE